MCRSFETMNGKAEYLLSKGVSIVIVTLDNRECFLKKFQAIKIFLAVDFSAIDSTGVSDAVISALSAYLLRDYSLEKAIQIASYAAGFLVSRDGITTALIDRMTL